MLCASAKGLILDTSALDCGPIVNPNSALIEVSNSVERLFRIELRVANKQSESASATRLCCNLVSSDLKRCDGIMPERRPRSRQRHKHANLDALFRRFGSLNFCGRSKHSEKQSTKDETKDGPNFHRHPMMSEAE
jgi:hypothetical protein